MFQHVRCHLNSVPVEKHTQTYTDMPQLTKAQWSQLLKIGSGKRCSCGLPGMVSAGGLSSPLPLSCKTRVCQSCPPSTSSPWTSPPVPPAHRRCVSVLWRSRSRDCRLAMTPARHHFSAFCLQLDAAGTKGRRWEASLWMHQHNKQQNNNSHVKRLMNSADILLVTTM